MSLRTRIARLEQNRRVEEASAPTPLRRADYHEELTLNLDIANLMLDIRRQPDQQKKEELQRKLDEAKKEYQRRWPQP